MMPDNVVLGTQQVEDSVAGVVRPQFRCHGRIPRRRECGGTTSGRSAANGRNPGPMRCKQETRCRSIPRNMSVTPMV